MMKVSKRAQVSGMPAVAGEAIALVLLIVGSSDVHLNAATRLVAHLTGATSRAIEVHLATDVPQTKAPANWQQHVLGNIPAPARELHEQYAKVTHGPGAIYMWKPLFHYLLPASIDRVLVLDTDLYLPKAAFDLGGLWDEFEHFAPRAALGLAHEQQPTYAKLGGGVNGGVQLLHLGRMREAGGAYDNALRRCATGACGDIGYLGDQTFYSAVRNTTPALVHVLPCGWNRQLSDQYWHDPSFTAYNACNDQCRMVHGNQPTFKRVLSQLQAIGGGQRRATCAECDAAVAAEGGAAPQSPGFAAMSKILHSCCCDEADGTGTVSVDEPTQTTAAIEAEVEAVPPARTASSAGAAPSNGATGRLGDLFGADIGDGTTGVLSRVAARVARGKEIITLSADASLVAAPLALNVIRQLRALDLDHVLHLSDSHASCLKLQRYDPAINCVWTSRIPATRPTPPSGCMRQFYDMRFYFYDVRKTMIASLVSDHGYNVLQSDTDVVWLADPYPALSHLAAAAPGSLLLAQFDLPLLNAGVFYYHGVQPSDGAAWVAREAAKRVHSFMWTPEAVAEHVPWAVPPYFANGDEQTIMNDCVLSATNGEVSYVSTAEWEERQGASRGYFIEAFNSTTRAQRVEALAGGAGWQPAKQAVSTEHARLIHAWESKRKPLLLSAGSGAAEVEAARGALEAVLRPAICTQSLQKASQPFEAQYASMTVPVAPGAPTAATPPSPSGFVVAPSWLFSHYPHDYTDVRPTDKAPPWGDACHVDEASTAATRAPTKARAVMLHMSGIRSGAWARRALLRGHGWWDAASDAPLVDHFGWGKRGGYLFAPQLITAAPSPRADAATSMAHARALLPTPTPAELDALVAGLLVVAAVANRTLVLPDVACPFTDEQRQDWSASNNHKLDERFVKIDGTDNRCSWVPPDQCRQVEYVTAKEAVRALLTAVPTLAAVPLAETAHAAEMPGVVDTGTLPPCARLTALLHAHGDNTSYLERPSSFISLLTKLVCTDAAPSPNLLEVSSTEGGLPILDGSLDEGTPLRMLLGETALLRQATANDLELRDCVAELLDLSAQHERASAAASAQGRRRSRAGSNALLPG